MANRYHFPPGPKSTNDINIQAMHKSFLDHNEKYGKISYFKLGGKNLVSLNTVEAIREALHSDELMDRPLTFSQKYLLTGDIAVQPYSKEWLDLRKAMQTGIKSMENYSEEMFAAQKSELKDLQAQLKKLTGSAFDPRELITKSVINGMIIGLVGRRFEYDHDIFRCFKQFDDNGRALYGSPKANYILGRFPCLRYLACGYGRKFQLTREAMDDLAGYLLHENKGHEDSEKHGLVYEMLRIQKEDASITDEKITAVIIDMHIGGILTMSAALFSLVFQLLCHPEIQKSLHEEIDAVIGMTTQVTFKHLDDMPFTQALLLELFRQCPVLPGAVPRSNKEEATVCGYHLPADTIFMPNLFGANHIEDVWDDAWTFNPQRFLDENGQLVSEDHPNRQNLVSFGYGRRVCPGETVARSRIPLYLVNLFQNYEFYNDVTQPLYDANPMTYTRDIILYPPIFMVKIRNRLNELSA